LLHKSLVYWYGLVDQSGFSYPYWDYGYIYMVNWSSYNESLIRCGGIMLDFDVIDSWYTELKRMNYGKKGVQYYYPDSFVELLGYMRVYFHLPYRQTEGVVRAHANEKVASIPDYGTINRRVNKLDIKINEKVDNDIVIALASTGIKVANREENGYSTNGILAH
jgi:hypothetical protein